MLFLKIFIYFYTGGFEIFQKNQISDQGFKVFSLKFPNLRGGVLNFFACGAIWVGGFLRKGGGFITNRLVPLQNAPQARFLVNI